MDASTISTWPSMGQVTSNESELLDEDLAYFCEAIEHRTGISLKMSKRDLIKTRLRSRLLHTKSATYKGYRNFLEGLPPDDSEWQKFINLMTTNKTDFFREPKHFDFLLAQILPAWLANNAETLNIWSAASSTGEEAYTLAMILDQYLPKEKTFKITATDIDTDVLKTAVNAVYPLHRLSEIPVEYHYSCLDMGHGEIQGWFRVKRRLKDKVHFAQHNLVSAILPRTDKFDVILCRNVLIYFSQPNIQTVCRKLFTMTKPNGHLFIGHSESFQGISHAWSTVGPSVYQKRAP